ncbi:hypothetical protein M5362_29060 [Streptomyces sp. Je 1-79]|nr:hypothetical protein [Streptomyces sp. Je 1-79]MCT4357170.1 hypothetical protein [Streptomyces sp. Je 1-79]
MPEKTLLARPAYNEAATGADASGWQPAPQYQGLFLEPDLPPAGDDED